MADGDQITQEEYGKWIPAREVLKRVGKVMGDKDIAAAAILRRLNAGLIRAHIKTGNIEYSGRIRPLKGLVAVPSNVAAFWTASSYHGSFQFWISGDAELQLRGRSDYGNDVNQIWRLFDIRFDPVGIEELAPTTAITTPPQTPANPQTVIKIETASNEPEQKGPRISSAALDAWYKAYKIAFPKESEDTEAKAMASARGCFPGKSVPREEVRALRGDQKRGPKPNSAK